MGSKQIRSRSIMSSFLLKYVPQGTAVNRVGFVEQFLGS